MQLAQAILFVHSADRMQAFYETLGLAVLEGDAASGFVRLADPAGGAVLALHATPAAGPGGTPRIDTRAKLCFHVADVEGARANLAARGVAMREVHRYGEVVFCDGVDPEGNVFQLTTRTR